jgi:benzoyl-CoA 2,3-dioxygenase component B
MLTEEAHHMFVGESGIGRIIERTCQVMCESEIEDPYNFEAIRALGVIDLPTMQKKANLHYSLSLDLFGSEISTNAANAFSAGVKGRYREDKIDDEHRLLDDTYPTLRLINGRAERVDESALKALNMRLRDDYARDCSRGLERWNKVVEKQGIEFKFKLPHDIFHRAIGEFAGVFASPSGNIISQQEFDRHHDEWLPSPGDDDYIASLMVPETRPGKYAGWIAAPKSGINKMPGKFEYVKIR